MNPLELTVLHRRYLADQKTLEDNLRVELFRLRKHILCMPRRRAQGILKCSATPLRRSEPGEHLPPPEILERLIDFARASGISEERIIGKEQEQ